MINNITDDPHRKGGLGQNRSGKSYYYRAVREKRCVLSDPYPSTLTNDLTVTASYPIYDEQGVLRFIACIDVSLEHILKIAHPSSLQSLFGKSFLFILELLFLPASFVVINSCCGTINLFIRLMFNSRLLS